MTTVKWPSTIEEYDAMTWQERHAVMIKFMQIMATLAGVHKTCRLPKCRRAKACATIEPPGDPSGGYRPRPVCLQDNANHAATVAMADALARRRHCPDGSPD